MSFRTISILKQIIGLYTQIIRRVQGEILVRKTCKRKGLSKRETELICAVIKCESGFDPKAINRNRNGTTDYGICQFNDYYYKDVIHPSVAFNNPQKAVEVMISQYKKGRLRDWVCFKYGYYKKHLKVSTKLSGIMPQQKNKFDRQTLIKISKGACIAGGGAALLYILKALNALDYGTSTPIITALLAVIINAVKEWHRGQESQEQGLSDDVIDN